jgi:hypothetical protein
MLLVALMISSALAFTPPVAIHPVNTVLHAVNGIWNTGNYWNIAPYDNLNL